MKPPATAIFPLATCPFINILGFGAVIPWIRLGYVLALEIRATTGLSSEARRPPRAPAAPPARLS